ncbi:n-terminal domain protein [Ichthyophthirius multifiliis]|uniref:N-terminal domain protein n=1 Tax=Ichthyophthirius multifiliis TaxID=5932 RepID=G0QM23_ICHMU|nr:n-terminal domain protein [Ichthyophthirius multifiliis]EGR33732.1 n-terminal domain protein [Ichthyophthirius multifiliis]|eukprot:XP_004037718.1 n-terminal domain protein [Ichthyophthirius multifiliis]
MYLSYEGGKLTSTIINLDIEELSYCLSCILLNYIEQDLNITFKNESRLEFEKSRNEIENILKESYLHIKQSQINNLNLNNLIEAQKQQKEIYETINQGELEENICTSENQENTSFQKEDIDDNNIYSTNLKFSTISRYSIVIPNNQQQNRLLFDKTYTENNPDNVLLVKPQQQTIQNYCKNIIISCKMEREIPIITLIYIERLLLNSGFSLNNLNWRKITITAMILASKIWDDESFENNNFSKAFPYFSVQQLNEMERVFVNFIDYSLYIKGQEYAKFYFILRGFAKKNKKSFHMRPLDIQTILNLQNNSNKAEYRLREIYNNALNKSF